MQEGNYVYVEWFMIIPQKHRHQIYVRPMLKCVFVSLACEIRWHTIFALGERLAFDYMEALLL